MKTASLLLAFWPCHVHAATIAAGAGICYRTRRPPRFRFPRRLGNTVNVKTIVAGVDNAREKVDANGNILGIIASETYSAMLDREIGQKWGVFLENIKKSLFAEPDSETPSRSKPSLKSRLSRAMSQTSCSSEPTDRSRLPPGRLDPDPRHQSRPCRGPRLQGSSHVVPAPRWPKARHELGKTVQSRLTLIDRKYTADRPS